MNLANQNQRRPLDSMAIENSLNFLNSLKNATKQTHPYTYYLLKDIFNSNIIKELEALPFEGKHLEYTLGTREEFNSTRQYFSPENMQKFACAKTVGDVFLNPKIIKTLEKLGNTSFQGSFLRIEYTIDYDHFWLKSHTDIGAKLFTMLMYLSEGDEASTWGTDIYSDENTHCATAPYAPNLGVIFYPSNNTWHGFRPRKINGIRKALIINYVKPEWRSRHELCDSLNPVY